MPEATATETTTTDATATPADQAPAPAATPSPADVAAQAAAAAADKANEPAPTDADKASKVDMTGWPQAAIDAYTKRDNDAARFQREAGDQRIQSKKNAADEARQEVLAALTKVLNPGAEDDKAPTVDELTATLAAKTLAAETVRAAYTNGVPADKLELLEFKLSRNPDVNTLDHTAADFGAKLSTIVQGEIARDASLAGSVASTTTTSTEGMVGDQAKGTVTQEAFNAMSMADRAVLLASDPETYRKLAQGQ